MQKFSLSKKKRLGFWLLGIVMFVVLLLATAFLSAEHFLASSTVKETIQQTLVAHTGIGIRYEQIGIGYFPAPMLELQQLTFSIPDKLKGKAATLRISPKITELLAGKLDLGKIELGQPDIHLELPEPQPAEHPAGTDILPGFKENLDLSLASVLSLLPAQHVNIADGRFSVVSGTRQWAGEHLDLILDGTMANARSGRVTLKLGLADLALHVGERRETIKGVQLEGNISAVDGSIAFQLDRLAAVNPALTLAGNLTLAEVTKEFTLSLVGTNIHVDATRKTALALAGDLPLVTDIFTYLVGGTIPQITCTAQGKSISELGDLKNIRIQGHLQDGAVSVPEIDMNLTGVNGEVVIAEGVLTGTGLAARLDGSTGHSGMLKIGLGEDNDLFQMELMLSADLGQVQHILKRVIQKKGFAQEIDRITRLQGTGSGKLILGDSLADMNASIENADLNLSFAYQRVPYPISITKGTVNLTKNQVALRGVSATMGKSEVSGLDVTVNWVKSVLLDISAERSTLSLDELYPWLNTMENVQVFLKDCKEISGRLDVSSARFTGDIDTPQQWSYTAAGAVSGLNLKTNLFPGPIKLTKGNFQLDRTQLAVQHVVAEGLDANLTLNGSISGLSSPSGQLVNVTVEGTMDKDSVTWLQDTLQLPKAYALRTPLTLKGVRVSGQPEKATLISGEISVKEGPQLTLDIQYQQEEVKVEQLTVKDQYSDAGMTFFSGREGLELSFTGSLRPETLEGLFVDPKWGKGLLEGDVSVHLPQQSKTGASAKGHLKGTNILIPLASGDEVSIEQVLLKADGSGVKADATTLSWRDFTWSPLTATINFKHDTLAITVDQAALCGIDSFGVVHITGKNFDLEATLQGKDLDLGTSYTCLTSGRVKMTGKMEFSSQVKAKGEMGELINKLEGPFTMTFRQGVIEQNRMLSTLLEVLNVTEIVKGRLPNMAATGFKYTIITMEGQFTKGKLLLDKLFVDGETLDILGYGEIDLAKETIDLELLAAPFKTVDTIIKYIPGINYLMGGNLVVIPVNVTGTLANPRVRIMSPSSVSKGLLNLGTRVLKLPYNALKSMVTEGKNTEKEAF